MATVVRAPGAHVYGLLYRVSVRELRVLDQFEGHPFVYERVRASVKDALGRRRRAQTYVLAEPQVGMAPAPDYLGVLIRAYGRLGFERRPLLDAALGRAA